MPDDTDQHHDQHHDQSQEHDHQHEQDRQGSLDLSVPPQPLVDAMVHPEFTDEERWRQCWPVVTSDVPNGLLVATAVQIFVEGSSDPKYRQGYSAGNKLYHVLWMGWAPQQGLMCAWSKWNPQLSSPAIPLQGWAGYSLTPKAPHGVPVVYVSSSTPLPFPDEAAQKRDRKRIAASLTKQNKTEFMSMLPLDTVSAAGMLVAGDGNNENPYKLPYELLSRTASKKDCLSADNVESWLPLLEYLLGYGDCFEVGAVQAGRNRRQFAINHAVFARFHRELTPQIDTGVRLVDYIARPIGCTPALVRALSGVPSQSIRPIMAFMTTNWGTALVDAMTRQHMPLLRGLEEQGWNSLSTLAGLYNAVAYDDRRSLSMGGVTSTRGYNRGQRDMVAHMGAGLAPEAGSLDWIGGCANSWAHITDLVRQMEVELVRPAVELTRMAGNARPFGAYVVGGTERERALRLALLCMGARKLSKTLNVHLAGQIHDARLGAALPRGEAGNHWGQASPDVVAPGGLTLRFLGSQAELTAEGRAMRHCVGSYGRQCAQRTSLIMSMGHWTGSDANVWKPSSTLELRLDGARGNAGNSRLRAAQHYGVQNSPAPQPNQEAAAWWLAMVLDKKIVLRQGCIRESGNQYNWPGGALAYLLGDAWNTPGAHAHRWDRWRRLLDTRAPSFGDWLLSLPPVYMNASQDHVRLVEVAVDMDDLMTRTAAEQRAEQIAAQEARAALDLVNAEPGEDDLDAQDGVPGPGPR